MSTHMMYSTGSPRIPPVSITNTRSSASGAKLIMRIGWLHRNMMRVGWGYMMKKLIPKVLGNVRGGEFTPGAIPLSQRAYGCKTVPDKYVR